MTRVPRRKAITRVRLTLGVLAALLLGSPVALAARKPKTTAAPVEIPIPPPTQAIGDLLVALKSPDREVRTRAAWALAGATGVKALVVDALHVATRDRERPVRYSATWALGHVTLDPSGLEVPDEPIPPVYEVEAKLIRQVRPVYPREAFDDKVEGKVVIEILIGEEGEVAHARVRHSTPALDQAALDCVRAWRFSPAMRGGQPAASIATVPVYFKIY